MRTSSSKEGFRIKSTEDFSAPELYFVSGADVRQTSGPVDKRWWAWERSFCQGEAIIMIRLALASVLSYHQGFDSWLLLFRFLPLFGWLQKEDLAVQFHQGQQGTRAASVEKEIPESGAVSLAYILIFLCILPLWERLPWGSSSGSVGRRNVNCPASGAKKELAEHNPNSPARSALTREKYSLHLPWERVAVLTTVTGNVKGNASPVYLVERNALPGYLVLQNMPWRSWHSLCLSLMLLMNNLVGLLCVSQFLSHWIS